MQSFKKILVTGGHGFIGLHLVKRLMYAGHMVTICDPAEPPNQEQLFCETIKSDVISYLNGLNTGETLSNLYPKADNYDYIFHLAATPRVGISLEFPEEVLDNNINALLSVLAYCRKHPKTKLIFISSSSVVWANLDFNPYAMSKKIGEQLVNTYRNTFNVQASTVRLFNVYGPGEISAGKFTTLVKQFKVAAMTGHIMEIHGNGSVVRDFTHVTDVIDGLETIMAEMETDVYQPLYELGSGKNLVSVNDIIKAFSKATTNVVFKDGRLADPPLTAALEHLIPKNWIPKISVLEHISAWIDDGMVDD